VLYGVEERKDAGWKAEGESGREQSSQNINPKEGRPESSLRLLLNQMMKQPNPVRRLTNYFILPQTPSEPVITPDYLDCDNKLP